MAEKTKKIKKLGRGMEALFNRDAQPKETISNQKAKTKKEQNKKVEKEEKKETIVFISVDDIKANPKQPRHHFDEQKIQELSLSIKKQGILQPLLVTKKNGKYLIVAGERRFRAAKLNGLKTVPTIILSITEEEIFETALVENIQREDLNPIELALSFQDLLRIKSYTHQQLATELGISRGVITNNLRLLGLPKNIQDAIVEEKISYSHAREILSNTNEKEQQKVFEKIIKNKLSVRDTVQQKKKLKNTEKQNIHVSEFQEILIKHFGTKVSITGSHKKGSIKIDFYSKEDLSRILNILGLQDENSL